MAAKNPLGQLEVSVLQHLYRSRSLSPSELINEVYHRIDRSTAANVWIHLEDKAKTLEAARWLERQDATRLPLYGIPFAVKDNIDVLGMPTTAGCPEYRYEPEASATAVQRLTQAGALCIGKTNLDQFATGLSGVRSPYGACSAVGNSDYVSGGSSSGSAVAVAAGLVSFSLGTDTGGSGRIPAGFNNVVGVKPTRGLIGAGGVVPNCRTLDCVSIFALNTEDGHAVLRTVYGVDERDPYSRAEAATVDLAWPGAALPFAFGTIREDQLNFGGDTLAENLYEQAVRRFEKLGGSAVEIDFRPFLEAGYLLFGGPFVAERYAALRPFVDNGGLNHTLPIIKGILESSHRWSGVDAFEAIYKIASLRRVVAHCFSDIAFLLTPTSPRPYTHAELASDPIGVNSAIGHYSHCVNLLDLAAIAVPNGIHSSNVASGVTLIGPALSDASLAVYASAFHQRTGMLRM